MRLQTWKPQKFKETLIGNHKETQKTLKTSGLFHFTRLVGILFLLFSQEIRSVVLVDKKIVKKLVW